MFTGFVHCLWVWKERTDVSERVCRLGRGPCHQKGVGFGVSKKAARSPRFRPNDGVLRREMRWQHVFTGFVHCLWVCKGRTDVSERVCRLGRGPCHQKYVGFEVSQAARSPRFRPNDGVLRREMRWQHVFTVFVVSLFKIIK